METRYAQSDNDGCFCGLCCRPTVCVGGRNEPYYCAVLDGEDRLFSIVRGCSRNLASTSPQRLRPNSARTSRKPAHLTSNVVLGSSALAALQVPVVRRT